MIRILLTETNDLLLRLNNSIFSRDGYMVMIARSGREVLKIKDEILPNLFFLDLDLPDMSGAACCRAVKTDGRSRHIPVIMVAPRDREDDRELCLDAGCDAVISKPIDCREFVSTAKRFIPITERAAPRRWLRFLVLFRAEGLPPRSGQALNLGEGGIFLETDAHLPENAVVTLDFILPHTDVEISCSARVAWVNDSHHPSKNTLPAGVGLQFLDLPSGKAEFIRTVTTESAVLPLVTRE